MIVTEGDKKFVETFYAAVFGETLQQMAERLKISAEETKTKRSIIRYYLKNGFQGLVLL